MTTTVSHICKPDQMNQKKEVNQIYGALFLRRPPPQPPHFPSVWQKWCCQLTLPTVTDCSEAPIFCEAKAGEKGKLSDPVAF